MPVQREGGTTRRPGTPLPNTAYYDPDPYRASGGRVGASPSREVDAHISYLTNLINRMNAPPAVPTQGMGIYGGGNSGGGGRGRGGGGGGGVNKAALKAQAEDLFKYDPTAANAYREQVNAYQPNIGQMTTQTQAGIQQTGDQRAAQVQATLANIQALAGGIAGQGSAAMQAALRDLIAQGVNASPYMEQAGQMTGRTQALMGNQAGFLGSLQALGVQQTADALQGAALIGQGGEANLANNRQVLLSKIAADELARKQQLEQAKREFLLKYGI